MSRIPHPKSAEAYGGNVVPSVPLAIEVDDVVAGSVVVDTVVVVVEVVVVELVSDVDEVVEVEE